MVAENVAFLRSSIFCMIVKVERSLFTISVSYIPKDRRQGPISRKALKLFGPEGKF